MTANVDGKARAETCYIAMAGYGSAHSFWHRRTWSNKPLSSRRRCAVNALTTALRSCARSTRTTFGWLGRIPVAAGPLQLRRCSAPPRTVKRAVPPARLLAALAVCFIAVAACGSSSKPRSSSTPSGSGSAGAQAVRFAQCMRSNGVQNYPDPSSGRRQSIDRIDPNSPAFQTADRACRKYAPNGYGGPPAPSAAQLRFALAFAHCMRAHGLSQFPDPLGTAPDGPNFTLGRGEYFPNIGTSELQSPAFKQAATACGSPPPP